MKQPRGKEYYNVVDKFIPLAKEYDIGGQSIIPAEMQGGTKEQIAKITENDQPHLLDGATEWNPPQVKKPKYGDAEAVDGEPADDKRSVTESFPSAKVDSDITSRERSQLATVPE